MHTLSLYRRSLSPVLPALALGSLMSLSAVAATDVIQLKAGHSERLVVGLEQVLLDEDFPSVAIDVPANALAIRVWTTDATGDVSLSGEYTGETEPGYEYEYGGVFGFIESDNIWLDEELMITKGDTQPLQSGPWTFTVGPSILPVDLNSFVPIVCNIHYEIIEPAKLEVRPDDALYFTLRRDEGLRAVLHLPDDFTTERNTRWRFEAYSGDHDIDLVIGPSNAAAALEFPYVTSIREIGYERAEFKGRQLKNLSFQVFALPELEVLNELPVVVRLTEITNLSDASPAPESLLPAVVPPAPNANLMTALELASYSTIAVYGPFGAGSGTILSTDGLVVTNAHVISGSHLVSTKAPTLSADGTEWAGDQKGRNTWLPSLHGGFNSDPRLPATAAFGLEIVDYRQDLDLALLRIVSTLDGQPLPKGIAFPRIQLGSSLELVLGSPLVALGFPMTGGSSTLVSITLTRGICAGFTTEPEGPAIKTDAGTHSGVSGGTLLNEKGHMVGIPSASITDANYAGGIGFAIPVESIPAEWLRKAGTSLPARMELPVSYAVACGCSLGSVGTCGNYIAIEGTYYPIANSKELGLGPMEWCKRLGVSAVAMGSLRDGHFHADSLRERP
jgi:S1-C subfamily serine protease